MSESKTKNHFNFNVNNSLNDFYKEIDGIDHSIKGVFYALKRNEINRKFNQFILAHT